MERQAVHIAHHPIFVALSIIVACLGSWTALDLFRRVRAHTGWWRGGWLAAAGIAMGLSIWSMHFIAMLGFDPGADVRYRIGLTILSLLLAIGVTTFAFFAVREYSRFRLLAAGAFMGLGICIMHYVGMAAVMTTARIGHDPVYVTMAFAVAITASTGALVAASGERTFLQRALAAVVLGFAIVGMHYTAMVGVILAPVAASTSVVDAGIDSLTLALIIAAGTMLILLLASIAALSDRREERLRRANEMLEERVAAALAEKAQAQAQLMHAQRLESLGRLTGGVAHDFNNLLTVVIGALDVILKDPENAVRRARLAEAALAAARRGEQLIAQLLAFGRRQPLRSEPCDLNDLIREGEPLMRRALGESLSFDLKLSETPALVRIDPAQFQAALLNLVVNAVDATPAGGAITVGTRLRDVSETECPEIPPGPYLCVRVSDTGQGMADDVLNRIFEPFFTTKPADKGTGLGLSQVYGFVRQSGGAVRVHSVPGTGTSFDLYLPVSQEGPQIEPSLRPIRKVDTALSILLAEDETSVAAITEAMLKNLGHRVTHAPDASQALAALRTRQQFDLLMTDVVMPGGMNGVELAREASALRPGLKIVLSSGYAGESLDRALADGVWSFLRKPYLQADLEACLGEIFKEAEQLAS